MTEYEIQWAYKTDHRYDSDLDEKVEEAAKAVIAGFGGEYTGSWGGTGFDPNPEAMVADSGFSFTAPTLEHADQVRRAADTLLKFYDDRYTAELKLPTTDEDLLHIWTLQLEEEEAELAATSDPEKREALQGDIGRLKALIDSLAYGPPEPCSHCGSIDGSHPLSEFDILP